MNTHTHSNIRVSVPLYRSALHIHCSGNWNWLQLWRRWEMLAVNAVVVQLMFTLTMMKQSTMPIINSELITTIFDDTAAAPAPVAEMWMINARFIMVLNVDPQVQGCSMGPLKFAKQKRMCVCGNPLSSGTCYYSYCCYITYPRLHTPLPFTQP